MIFRFDHGVMMCDENLVTAHDGTDGGAVWQLDLTYGATDHA